MRTQTLGNSGVKVTSLTYGCWQAAPGDWPQSQLEEVKAAMLIAFKRGIRSFDTAEGYGEGASERMLGRAILKYFREEVTVSTKVGPWNYRRPAVIEACERSLRNLGTDRIDIYFLHWPAGTWGTDASIPLEETMGAMLDLKNAGKIRAIGLSNFGLEHFERARKIAPIDAHQPPMSLLFHPYVDNLTMGYCRRNGISVMPYSPLAQGLLTGTFTADNRPTEGSRAGNLLFREPTYEKALEAVNRIKLSGIPEKYHATLGEIALAWLLALPGVTSPIVGASKPYQIKESIAALTINLEPDDIDQLTLIGREFTDSLPTDATNLWA